MLATATLGAMAVALVSLGLVSLRGDGSTTTPAAPGLAAATPEALDTAARAALDSKSARAPNLILFYIDDQGYNDMGNHSTDLSSWTPHISAAADEGIWLSNYYGQQVCTPSRAALLTGMYPIHSGMQHGMIAGNAMWGLDRSLTLLPEMLKTAGDYNTHMIGKWHLGHFQESFLPLQRGFETHFGYYSGYEGYHSHTAEDTICYDEKDCYHDLRDNTVPVEGDTYNMFLFENRMQELIAHYGALDTKAKTSPFFLYFASSATHHPLTCPEEFMTSLSQKMASIPNDERKMFACLTYVMDRTFGNMTSLLKSTGMWEDTLVIAASDNGANTQAAAGGSNWPLRGMKGYLWEGSFRVNALVSGGFVPAAARGTVYGGLFHVTDWVPTLLDGVLNRGDVLSGQTVDGHNQWDNLLTKAASPRTTMVYNIDKLANKTYGAIRVGDWKLLVNVQKSSVWPVPSGNNYSVTEFFFDTKFTDFLFNVVDDPTESHDLRLARPDKFTEMYQRFSEYKASMVPPSYCGYKNNTIAQDAFRKEQFIRPWYNDSITFECPTTTNEQESLYQLADECLYLLRPASSCVSAKKLAALPEMKASAGSSHPPPEGSEDTGKV